MYRAGATVERLKVNAKQFGARLRELRKAADLTQADLAERVGVSFVTVSLWEKGTRSPNFIDVVRVAAVLGRRIEDFAIIPDVIPKRELGRPKSVKPAPPADETVG